MFYHTVNGLHEFLRTRQPSENNVIRRIWNLPQRSHTSVVHCLGSTGGIHNIIFSKFCTMFNACISHASPLICSIFTVSAQSCNSNFIGYSEQPFLCPACCQAHNLQQIAKLDSLWERVQIQTSWKLEPCFKVATSTNTMTNVAVLAISA